MTKLKSIIIISVNALLTVLLLLCVLSYNKLAGMHSSQLAAERWTGDSDERFAQISCFFPQDGAPEQGIYSIRESVESKLQENSFEAQEGARQYVDAYCAYGQLSVSSERAAAQVSVIGVGGDFFFFHPLRLRSGVYFDGSDLMQDRVVIDEDLAWKLFGAYDVAGMELTIGGVPHFVAGVISRDSDFATERAYESEGGMYVSYETLETYGQSAVMSVYEIVLPNPITGIGAKIMGEIFPQGTAEIVENTSRFKVERIFGMLSDFGSRSMRTVAVRYPFWENAARITEDYMALLLVLAFILSLIPMVSILVLITLLFRKLKSRRGEIFAAVGRYYERVTQARRRRLYDKVNQTHSNNKRLDNSQRRLNPSRNGRRPSSGTASGTVSGTVRPLPELEPKQSDGTKPERESERTADDIRFEISTIVSEVLAENEKEDS